MKQKYTDLVCKSCGGSYPIHNPGCTLKNFIGVWQQVETTTNHRLVKMLWQVVQFEIEWENGNKAQFISTFKYESEVFPYDSHEKYGIRIIRLKQVHTWISEDQQFNIEKVEWL